MTDAFDLVLATLRAHGCAPHANGSDTTAARCPAHDDQRASLSVSRGTKGVVLHCHAGCQYATIMETLGLAPGDGFDTTPEQREPLRRITATYGYTDERGELLYEVVRFEPKGFAQRRPDGNGNWTWKLDGCRRVLYRLPDVLAATTDRREVYVAEGEKDAEALVRAGVTATCNPAGAGKWRDSYAASLVGASRVVVVSDRDEPGRRHAHEVAESCRHAGLDAVIVEPASGKDASDHLGAGLGLDALVAALDQVATPAPAPLHVVAAPAHAPRSAAVRKVSTGALLRALEITLRRYVVFANPAQVTACALWVLHTHVFESFETTPYLAITSAVKRSGKSRLLELLRLLVARPWLVTEPSEATLFRKIEASKPTLLVDEIDATFGKDSAATEGLRAIYNAGYRRGATVPRCDGRSHEVRDFAVYCPKAFAGIKALPDTVADRSIPVVLRRRARHERTPRRFRLSKAAVDLASLAGALAAWSEEHAATLAEAEPVLPEELSDRAQDAWEPLLAIADLVGTPWAERARRAGIELHGDAEDQDLGTLLLAHCRDAFGDREKLATVDLLDHLVNRGDESPWARWWGDDLDHAKTKGPASRLASLLKPFGITPAQLWLGGAKTRGYEREAFAEAWQRYCPTVAFPLPTDPKDGRTVERRSEAISATPAQDPETCPDQGSTVLPFLPTVGSECETVVPASDAPHDLGTVPAPCVECGTPTARHDTEGYPWCSRCEAAALAPDDDEEPF